MYRTQFTEEELAALERARERAALEDESELLRVLILRLISAEADEPTTEPPKPKLDYRSIGLLVEKLRAVAQARRALGQGAGDDETLRAMLERAGQAVLDDERGRAEGGQE